MRGTPPGLFAMVSECAGHLCGAFQSDHSPRTGDTGACCSVADLLRRGLGTLLTWHRKSAAGNMTHAGSASLPDPAPEPYRGVAIMTSALVSEPWVPLKPPLAAWHLTGWEFEFCV